LHPYLERCNVSETSEAAPMHVSSAATRLGLTTALFVASGSAAGAQCTGANKPGRLSGAVRPEQREYFPTTDGER